MGKNKEIRISLDYEDFKALVCGEIVEKDGVKIILQDIGYYGMGQAIGEALNKGHMKDV